MPTPTQQNSPLVRLRIAADERDELKQMAAEAGVSLSLALRHGARLYLLAITAPREREHKLGTGKVAA